jgi:hypothetical protein
MENNKKLLESIQNVMQEIREHQSKNNLNQDKEIKNMVKRVKKENKFIEYQPIRPD